MRDILVSIGGKNVKGSALDWTAEDGVTVADGLLKATKPGITTATVSDGTNTRGINIVAKAADATEFVLYENDFSALKTGLCRKDGS